MEELLIEETLSEGTSTYACTKGWAARCGRAKRPRCKCACGGHNHGTPVAIRNTDKAKNEPTDPALPAFQPFAEEILKAGKTCRWCGAVLTGPVYGYPHNGGWEVSGLDGKYWLYLHCEGCGYNWSLWKLGVSR